MPEEKNIPYIDPKHPDFDAKKHVLNLFYPETGNAAVPMMVYIHGGTWISGSGDLYSPLGRNLAHLGIAVAIINYRLGDTTNYMGMGADCAAAVKWVYEHAARYHADPERITVCGHSAGGHLSALISLDPGYFEALQLPNPIKACILIDAFGLNIETFIRKQFGQSYIYYIEKVFTKDEANWTKASPITYVGERKLPFYVLTGGSTYPFVLADNASFIGELRRLHCDVLYESIPGKNHMEMIVQMENSHSPMYEKLRNFIRSRGK